MKVYLLQSCWGEYSDYNHTELFIVESKELAISLVNKAKLIFNEENIVYAKIKQWESDYLIANPKSDYPRPNDPWGYRTNNPTAEEKEILLKYFQEDSEWRRIHDPLSRSYYEELWRPIFEQHLSEPFLTIFFNHFLQETLREGISYQELEILE